MSEPVARKHGSLHDLLCCAEALPSVHAQSASRGPGCGPLKLEVALTLQ